LALRKSFNANDLTFQTVEDGFGVDLRAEHGAGADVGG
jgi:hypothetical protein